MRVCGRAASEGQGLGAACTLREVARMSFTIIEALGIVLDKLLFTRLSTQLHVSFLVEELVLFEDLRGLHSV